MFIFFVILRKFCVYMRYFSILLIISFLLSCSEGAGEGGRATIKGKIKEKNYYDDGYFDLLLGEYPSQGEDVYIIYGDEPSFGDRTKTNHDGVYEFRYLRKGKYTIYAYSKDSVRYYNGEPNPFGSAIDNKTKAEIQQVEITERSQTVNVPEITVIK